MLSSINVTKSTIMRIIKESIMSKGKVTNDGKVIQSSNKKVQGEGKTNGETGSQREVHVDSFTINVFFDGTKIIYTTLSVGRKILKCIRVKKQLVHMKAISMTIPMCRIFIRQENR